ILDLLVAAFFILFPVDQPDFDLQWGGIGHPALQTFPDIILRQADRIVHEFDHGGFLFILKWKETLENRLKSDVLSLFRTDDHLKKSFIRLLLDFDQIRNIDLRRNLREIPPVLQSCHPKLSHRCSPSNLLIYPQPTYLISTLAPTSSSFFFIVS